MDFDDEGVPIPETVADWLVATTTNCVSQMELPWQHENWLMSTNAVEMRIIKRKASPVEWRPIIPSPLDAKARFAASRNDLFRVVDTAAKTGRTMMAIAYEGQILVVDPARIKNTLTQMGLQVVVTMYRNMLSIASGDMFTLIMACDQGGRNALLTDVAKEASAAPGIVFCTFSVLGNVVGHTVSTEDVPEEYFEPYRELNGGANG
jgi:hypothetical protein